MKLNLIGQISHVTGTPVTSLFQKGTLYTDQAACWCGPVLVSADKFDRIFFMKMVVLYLLRASDKKG